MVFQVPYDLSPGPLSHLIYSLLVLWLTVLQPCWPPGWSPWYVRDIPIVRFLYILFFALRRGCCSLDTVWSLLTCHFLHEAIPKNLIHNGTLVTLPAFPSTALSFNGTGLHLALPNGRDTWLKRTGSSERGQWKKIIPRRQVKYVMQQRESSRCPQNSESIWTNLCMRLGMKKPFSTSSPRALYAL